MVRESDVDGVTLEVLDSDGVTDLESETEGVKEGESDTDPVSETVAVAVLVTDFDGVTEAL